MVVGIFGSYNFSILEKPDEAFKKKLNQNPYFPFEETATNLFRLKVRSVKFIFGLVSTFALGLTAIILYATNGIELGETLLYFVIGFLALTSITLYYKEERTLLLDINNSTYEFYRGDRLVYQGHNHNIYIRLKGEKSGSGEMYYNVTLNGFQVDEQMLTSATRSNKEKLRRLGRRLASHLNLNYFDYLDKSRHHVIRHRCPYSSYVSLTNA
ncbi:unnamed protein product [Owenia fusiformis]|uniref:Transmembrane protein 249 n=1 Tax=Owenia fusiformis TaxID=6347 RepID=A0A8S4MYV0_OWEFU|nr:unnamed protein product [Owenia fusiformis]